MKINHNYGDDLYVSTWELLVRRMQVFDRLPKQVREKLSQCLMPFEPTDVAIEQRKGRTIAFLVDGLQKADERYHIDLVLRGKVAALPSSGGRLQFDLTPNPNPIVPIWERRNARRMKAMSERTARRASLHRAVAV